MMAVDDTARLRHALRTPLNHIIGYSEIVMDEAAEAGRQDIRVPLESIRNRARQVVETVQAHMPAGAAATQADLRLLRSAIASHLRGATETLDEIQRDESHRFDDDLERIRNAIRELLEFCQGGGLQEYTFESLAAPASSLEGQSGRLLVVDDNEFNRDMLSRRLEREGFAVITAASGTQGLELLSAEKFDLVLLDMVMPELDGFSVLSRIKSDPALHSMPVVMISALDDMPNVTRCLEMGAEDFVPKPFDPVLLRVRISAILKRKRAEEERKEMAETFRLLLESTAEGIYGLNSAGECIFINAAASKMVGYTREELQGRTMHEMIHHSRPDGSRYPSETCPMQLAAQKGESHRGSGELLFRRDGTAFPVDFTAQPLFKNGLVDGAVVTFSDISERQRTEEQMREAAKMESLGVLAGGVAHDFNNLLTGILGNTTLVADSLKEGDPNRQLLEEAAKASERAAELTRQMLAFAGKGNFVISRLDLSSVVSEMRDLVEASVPKRLTILWSLEQTIPPVEADLDQIRQLLLNLVINAAEAIGDSPGTILVETGFREIDESAARAARGAEMTPGHYVFLAVQDNGPGMDEATSARIFEPFFSTKFLGRGLGLPAVLGIVRSCHGGIHVNTAPGQGSRFEVFLPACEHPALTAPKVDLGKADPHGHETVLVVDDEEVVRRTAKLALEKYGYRVLLANSGQEGVELFRTHCKDVALIILDLTMPTMDGDEAYRYLRAVRHDVPILISSGYSGQQVARRFQGRALAGFVQKPYNAATLAREVRQALAANA